MLKLAESYGDRPSEELPLLFQRILQNAIRDYYRRSKVRATWTTLLSVFGGSDEDGDENDPLDTLEIEPQSEAHLSPDQQLHRVQTLNLIDEALQQLPARQREAFLLRYMEEMDVAETAAAMGCSEGSVKTHCSRAVHALAAWLKDKGVSP
jgi:RNA polymerase sigma-70 factor (ECF subfamily)